MSSVSLAGNRKLQLAIALNLALALILVVPPLVMRGPGAEVVVDPEDIPLNGNATVKVRFDDVPSSARLEILQGPDLRPVQVFQLGQSREASVTVFAEEGVYSVGLHVARVVATVGGREVTAEVPFSVYHGGELRVEASVSPEEVVARSLPDASANVSATITVTVRNELGRPVEGALIFSKSRGSQTGHVDLSPNPAKTDPDGVATVTWTLTVPANLTEGNLTDVVSMVIGAPGHPVARASVEVRARVEPARP